MPGTVGDLLAAARKASQNAQQAQDAARATAAALKPRPGPPGGAAAGTAPHEGGSA